VRLRSFLWRIGRFLYKYARKESLYSSEKNGEFWLIKTLVKNANKNGKLVFLDIGAFKGEWTQNVLKNLNLEKIKGKIYCFEPAFNTFKFLKDCVKNEKRIILSNSALSEKSGKKDFFIFGALNGTNTLIKNKSGSIHEVNTITVDKFLEVNKLTNIDFIKSDTEGHDFSVIKGAKKSFQNQLIDFWQFEYNHRWIDNRSYLKDVFTFFEGSNYLIGKVCVDRIEIFIDWHEELERYYEANYLILNKKYLNKIMFNKVKFNKFSVVENE
jgi:FkbM family methyltransferase